MSGRQRQVVRVFPRFLTLGLLSLSLQSLGLLPDLVFAEVTGSEFGQESDASPEMRRVTVRVTAVQGLEVYLDLGQEAGLAVGDRVQLSATLGPSLEARIVAVTRRSSRARIERSQEPAQGAIEIGDEGQILIPVTRLGEQGAAGEQETGVPAHPPWTHEPVQWEEGLPLLAPIHGRTASERERVFRGRVFTSYDLTRDQASVDSTYSALRAGFDGEMDNPFGRGGQLQLDLAYSRRDTEVEDAEDESESLERINRASYAIGGHRDDPQRYEVGRFLHSEFPELGLIDGLEAVHRFANGSRAGASVGYLPTYDDEMSTGDDLAISVFGRWVESEEERLALGAAFQKTWHEGDADRDLLIADIDWFASDTLSFQASSWVDLFTGDDDLEDSSASLTRLRMTGTWRPRAGTGLSLFASRLDWPQLLRDEFEPVADETQLDYAVTQVGVRGWIPLSKVTRLRARVDQWSDEEASGLGGEVAISTRDLLWDRGNFSMALRSREGRFSETTGLRLRASRALRRGALSLRYDLALQDTSGVLGSSDDALQQTLTGNWDYSLGGGWDFSAYLEGRFGDDQDSQTVGLFLQRRF